MTPTVMVAFAGAAVMLDRAGGVSVTAASVVPVTLPTVAETIAVPVPAMVARPVSSMVSAEWFDDVHVAAPVTSWVEVSEYVPVAVNCCWFPGLRVGLAGDTVTLVRAGGAALTLSVA